MNGLAWALLSLGSLLIVGVYAWGQFRLQRRERRIVEHMFDQEPVEPPSMPTGREATALEVQALADLESLRVEGPSKAEPGSALGETKPRRRPASERYGQKALDLEAVPTPEPLPGTILALHIIAREGKSFGGLSLERVLREAHLQHGEMGIYHHHGVGQSQGSVPVFSLANMFEPGTFDPALMDDFETRGLSLFMQLPGPMDGSVAFELMLASAQRLSQELDGLLLSANRNPLDAPALAELRQRATPYRAYG